MHSFVNLVWQYEICYLLVTYVSITPDFLQLGTQKFMWYMFEHANKRKGYQEYCFMGCDTKWSGKSFGGTYHLNFYG
jgi:hypothetical protein